jgi:hypothetical protein
MSRTPCFGEWYDYNDYSDPETYWGTILTAYKTAIERANDTADIESDDPHGTTFKRSDVATKLSTIESANCPANESAIVAAECNADGTAHDAAVISSIRSAESAAYGAAYDAAVISSIRSAN